LSKELISICNAVVQIAHLVISEAAKVFGIHVVD
jgi:hypothetical protein